MNRSNIHDDFQKTKDCRCMLHHDRASPEMVKAFRKHVVIPEECGVCGRSPQKDNITLLFCEGCRSARYCSKTCQISSWRGGHRLVCEAGRGSGLSNLQKTWASHEVFMFYLLGCALSLLGLDEDIRNGKEIPTQFLRMQALLVPSNNSITRADIVHSNLDNLRRKMYAAEIYGIPHFSELEVDPSPSAAALQAAENGARPQGEIDPAYTAHVSSGPHEDHETGPHEPSTHEPGLHETGPRAMIVVEIQHTGGSFVCCLQPTLKSISSLGAGERAQSFVDRDGEVAKDVAYLLSHLNSHLIVDTKNKHLMRTKMKRMDKEQYINHIELVRILVHK